MNKKYNREELKNSVKNNKDEKIKNFAITNNLSKEMCVGCGACVSICPQNALSLKPDELGFYRANINKSKCNNCGLCSKVCPSLNPPEKNNSKETTCYEFIASDKKVLFKSSSGGAFSLLAREALKRRGVVFGAAWKKNFTVKHVMVNRKFNLSKLQKSKYLQSYLGDIFRKVKNKLEKNKFVLFSGCPCQIAGLKSYLKKDYDNLILVDLLCAYVPSQMFFRKYIEGEFPKGIKKYEFRHKIPEENNMNCETIKIYLKSGKNIIRKGIRKDKYQRVFHNFTMCPYHCENCKYQGSTRYGDITIGDFWGIENKDKLLDTKKGVSLILCNNKKGKDYFNSLPEKVIGLKKEVPPDWRGKNGYGSYNAKNYLIRRDLFFSAIKNKTFSESVNYALKPNHGIYRNNSSSSPLNYDTSMLHFKFNSDLWEERFMDDNTVLLSKAKTAEMGKFAILPLCKLLEKDKKYKFTARFKIKTDSNILNFNIKDSGSDFHQIIHHYKLDKCVEDDWIQVSNTFIPNSDIYDELMISASKVYGEGSYIIFDYINISEDFNYYRKRSVK